MLLWDNWERAIKTLGKRKPEAIADKRRTTETAPPGSTPQTVPIGLARCIDLAKPGLLRRLLFGAV